MSTYFNIQQQQGNTQGMSGVQMKANAYAYNPEEIEEKLVKGANAQGSNMPENTNLLDEDTSLYVTSENQLLAATSFEQMSLDPRFIDALYSSSVFI